MSLLVVKDAAQIAVSSTRVGDNGRHVGPQSFRDELERAGVTPSYGHACLFPIQEISFLLMANHELASTPPMPPRSPRRRCAPAADSSTRARPSQARRPVDGLQIAATPEQIGIRDGRRIRGR